jgi:hypothetical protein
MDIFSFNLKFQTRNADSKIMDIDYPRLWTFFRSISSFRHERPILMTMLI